MKFQVKGKISTKTPTVFIANHVGYLDIVTLGALAPLSFVAKAEIARWPLFGTLARLQNTVFVDRKRRNAAEHIDAAAKHLQNHGNLVIFPEGTSGDGNRILPFKPTLFRVADTKIDKYQPIIQPVCIAYTHLNGLPITRLERPFFAWYGDMDIASHLWRLLALGKFTVQVTFFDPIDPSRFDSHKALSQHCQTIVSESFSAKYRGISVDTKHGPTFGPSLTAPMRVIG